MKAKERVSSLVLSVFQGPQQPWQGWQERSKEGNRETVGVWQLYPLQPHKPQPPAQI